MTGPTRALVAALLLASWGTSALAQQSGGQAGPAPAAATSAAGPTVVGELLPPPGAPGADQVAADWMDLRPPASPHEERIRIDLPPGDSPLVQYVFTNRGGTIRNAFMTHERYTRDEVPGEVNLPLPNGRTMKIGVPTDKYREDQVDVVSSWDGAFLPFRVVFGEFKSTSVVDRLVRRTKRGVLKGDTLLPPPEGTFEVDRVVVSGDEVIITSPEALKGPYKVEEVTSAGQVILDKRPGDKDTDKEHRDVVYEIHRKGDFNKVFLADPTFARVSGGEHEVGLPLVYVFPDPATDESDIFLEKRFDAIADKAGGEQTFRPYQLRLTVALYNLGNRDADVGLGLRVGGWQHPASVPQSGGCFSCGTCTGAGMMSDTHGSACYVAGSLEREDFSALLSEIMEERRQPAFSGGASWVGVDNRYFLVAAAPIRGQDSQCVLDATTTGVIGATLLYSTEELPGSIKACAPKWMPAGRAYVACGDAMRRLLEAAKAAGVDDQLRPRRIWDELALKYGDSTPENDKKLKELRAVYEAAMSPDKSKRHASEFLLYTGPKDSDALAAAIETELGEAMDYGWFGFIAKPLHELMRWIESGVGHWGLAIILLTLIIKVLLLPLSNWSYKSIQKQQKLKPELDKLKEETKGDKAAFQKEMMALYKRHGVNPFVGCLPMLIQMPIWIALYQTILRSVELFHAPLGLWIDDLSAKDPYFIMPILLGVLMLAQSLLTTSTAGMEGMQAKLMKYGMPVMFTFIMLYLPSGLVLYILVNTLLTIVQNLIIRRRMA